jgi:NAD(P)H dehydrogenase (quinone)
VQSHGGFEARLRTVPPVSATTEQTTPAIAEHGAVYCTKQDLADCQALALGSATRFGNMAAALKHFLDGTSDLWLGHQLAGKPAGVFCSTGSMHGGQESTLLSMMIPLLHYGMVIAGLPYSERALNQTTSGGGPYGPSHVSGPNQISELTLDEQTLATALGRRLATLAEMLNP